jgi:hypothetical protein
VKPVLEPQEQTGALAQLTPLQEAAHGVSPVEFTLNVAVVYEDLPTRRWASEFCGRVGKLFGPDTIRNTWWKMSELDEPAVLAGAVSTAMRADVIVVAVRAAEGLPLPFYVWVDSWLPYHPQGLSALVALIAMPDNPGAPLDRARNYLSAVARQGRLEFLVEERKFAPPS